MGFSDLAEKVMLGGTKQLLLVEDDEQALRILERWVADAGYDVVSFTRFDAGRAYLNDHVPDAIVTDVRLGAFNGLQLVLVAKSANPAVVAVVVSGFTDPVLQAEAERAGAQYLAKPLSRDELIAALGGGAEPEPA